MPRGVHNRAMRHIGQNLLRRFDTHDIRGVVKRPQIFNFVKGGHCRVVYDNALCKFHSAVQNAVSDCLDYRHIAYNARFLVR